VQKYGGVQEICNKLYTSPTEGISGSEVDIEHRRHTFGSNTIPPKPPLKTFLQLVQEASQDFMILALLFCALMSSLLSVYTHFHTSGGPEADEDEAKYGWVESLSIIFSVVLVVIITALNDYMKERQFQGLQSRIEGQNEFSVIRAGEVRQIPVGDIVVGDVCQVKYGDLLPADGILIHSNDLKLDESSLTGESKLVKKGEHIDPMLLSGSYVMEGSGKMIVTAVGVNSQANITSTLLGAAADQPEAAAQSSESHKKERSALHAKLAKLSCHIGYAGLTIAVLTVLVLVGKFCVKTYMVEGSSWKNIHVQELLKYFIIGVTMLVVAVPQGHPLAVTIVLAYTAKKMMENSNFVRHDNACEAIGNITSICFDKTGTLTTNRMTVVQSHICENLSKTTTKFSEIPSHVRNLLIQAISINSSYTSYIMPSDGAGVLTKQVGNKTECALLEFVEALGKSYQTFRDGIPEEKFIQVYTFNSVRKSMSTVIPQHRGGYRLFTKGAPETVLKKCAYIYGQDGNLKELTQEMQERLFHQIAEPMACDGLRIIAIAYREFVPGKAEINQVHIDNEPNWDDEENIVNNLTCIGLVGIEDPVRPEVIEAIRKCQMAGITVHMITGDNIDTAWSTAIKCGILKPGDDFLALEGTEFNLSIRDNNGQIQKHLLDELCSRLRVLARSSPTDKLTLLKDIQDSKVGDDREVAAVTGDGANDVPALKTADVGIAMGITGTSVA
jgi:Ca2+ transporting ATPase